MILSYKRIVSIAFFAWILFCELPFSNAKSFVHRNAFGLIQPTLPYAQGALFLYKQRSLWQMYGKYTLKSLLWAPSLDAWLVQMQQQATMIPRTSYQVRVLLDDAMDRAQWEIHSSQGFFIYNALRDQYIRFPKSETITVALYQGFLSINKKRGPYSHLIIWPRNGHLTYKGKQYDGCFIIIADANGNRGYLINQLDIEDYVCSVLRSESWPGWPVEVNKAFAIASRSYLIAKIFEAAKKKQPYHIKNTNSHQTYTGVHGYKNLQQAVDETKGIILTYEQQPALTMFDSCCGGIIPAHIKQEHVVDFQKAPYLAREYACTFCKQCKIFNWKIKYSFDEVLKLLRDSGISLNKIHTIAVTKEDKAGTVQEIQVHDGKTTYSLSGKQCYSLFGNIKSFCFSLEKKKESIIFTGKGYGHHIGICQWGARTMIDHGWDFRRILQFYYPGTSMMRLTYNGKMDN